MREILLCDYCKGVGKILKRVNLHEDSEQMCSRCKGSGRLVKTTTVIIEPYTVK